MSSYINAASRRLVAIRANSLCEYCLIHEEDAFFGCEVDHIISEKRADACQPLIAQALTHSSTI